MKYIYDNNYIVDIVHRIVYVLALNDEVESTLWEGRNKATYYLYHGRYELNF